MIKSDEIELVKNENPVEVEVRIAELKTELSPVEVEARLAELRTESDELKTEFAKLRNSKAKLITEFNELKKFKAEFNKLRRLKNTLHKATINLANSIEGWMSKKELSWLYKIAASYKDKIEWVEIGSWKGRSLVATALGLPKFSRLFSIDPHASKENLIQLNFPIPYVKKGLHLTIELIKNLRPDSYVEHFAEASENASERFKNDQLNVVFIDGCHEYESVKKDIDLWLPKIKKDGLICGHDRKRVILAVKDVLGEVTEGPGSIWYKHLR